ncbi:unnamed protein product [Haemonchus placei]|uniref:Uncharacterized protein n=1 Tax=Haemonchus placei TaxID=6290 RepID=A0A0N4X9M1_HAEPC|nr:unnamed protein product [Haemonchus placei]
MTSPRLLHPDDADDSDSSSDGTCLPVKVLPRRSATVSPRMRGVLRESRLDTGERKRRRSMVKNSRDSSIVRRRLRKTSSEPNVEGVGMTDMKTCKRGWLA